MRTYPQQRLAPAKDVIELLGGPTRASRLLGVAHSNVLRWMYPKDAGGTGGIIPQRHHEHIMTVARDDGVVLTPLNFYAKSEPSRAAS